MHHTLCTMHIIKFIDHSFWFSQTFRLKTVIAFVFMIADKQDLADPLIQKKTTVPGRPKLYPAFRVHMDLYYAIGGKNVTSSLFVQPML